ncbi:MAG: GxxExxY protein [Gammaproteobacteria bacterium]|nr:GxxExxY protein [Gammaproteobacteria bacterium]
MEFQKRISERVIGCAMTVSSTLGVGFTESVYENALAIELMKSELSFERQKPLQVSYRNKIVGNFYADFIVEDKLILELKALSQLRSEHEAQVMNYLKAGNLNAGLLLNFGSPRLGIKRIVLNYAEHKAI